MAALHVRDQDSLPVSDNSWKCMGRCRDSKSQGGAAAWPDGTAMAAQIKNSISVRQQLPVRLAVYPGVNRKGNVPGRHRFSLNVSWYLVRWTCNGHSGPNFSTGPTQLRQQEDERTAAPHLGVKDSRTFRHLRCPIVRYAIS
jgi:hypothetical protein